MLRTAVLILSLGTAAFASSTVATLTSSQPVSLDGHLLQGVVISSWPLVAGDLVTTSDSPATLNFKDGSRVELAKGSAANVVGSIDAPKVVLTSGSLDYKIAPNSRLLVAKAAINAKPSETDSKRAGRVRSSLLANSAAYTAVAGMGAAAGLMATSSSSSSPLSVVQGTVSTPISSLAPGPVAHNSLPLSCPVNVLGFVLLYDPYVPAKFGGPQITCWDPLIISPFYKHLWYEPTYTP